MKKMVLFGAGKIGRSFVGQLFARSGYEVVFVDIFRPAIDALNDRGRYDVVIKSAEGDEVITVENVRGVMATDTAQVASEIADCDIAAVSVGQKGLDGIMAALAAGLELRLRRHGKRPLDIILAENMRDASGYMRLMLSLLLPEGFPLCEMAGLVETSIGKMVPIMAEAIQKQDTLLVYAEPYNTLIVDGKGFLNPIPDVAGLAPKDNIKAWVDRKSYIHNLGHAAAAYAGFRKHPEAVCLWEVLEEDELREQTCAAMSESATILMHKYPGEFIAEALQAHIDDLVERFRNRALGDTVFRVGCDLGRKLHRSDRVLSPILDGIAQGAEVSALIGVFADGLCFRALNEAGRLFPGDADFIKTLETRGLEYTLETVCDLNPADKAQRTAIEMITKKFNTPY